MLAGALDLLQVRDHGVLAFVGGVFLQDLRIADDGVQRRAQLVAHIGQELGLGLVGLFGGVARLLDRSLGLLARGDVVDPAGQGGMAVVLQPLPGQEAPEYVAIGPPVPDLRVAQHAGRPKDPEEPLPLGGVDPHLAGEPGGFVVVVAVDRVVGGVAIEVAAFLREDHHRDRRGFQKPLRLVGGAIAAGHVLAHAAVPEGATPSAHSLWSKPCLPDGRCASSRDVARDNPPIANIVMRENQVTRQIDDRSPGYSGLRRRSGAGSRRHRRTPASPPHGRGSRRPARLPARRRRQTPATRPRGAPRRASRRARPPR